jgi:hypothetical protein
MRKYIYIQVGPLTRINLHINAINFRDPQILAFKVLERHFKL